VIDYDDAWYEAWKRNMIDHGGNIIVTLGIRLLSVDAERALLQMPHSGAIQQGTGVVAAGALMQLADVGATSLILHALREAGQDEAFPLAIQISMNLVRNVDRGRVRSESRFVHRGLTVTVVESRVRDEAERLLCTVQSTHVAAPGRSR
jgi:uncharacterized protein (TIGR00369 family)